MTVYNGSRFLDAAIKSVKDQTHSSWRLYIVDDGSSDDSLEIIKRWAAKEPRILFSHQEHSGRGAALKTAERLLPQDNVGWVGWIDADDMLHPNCLAECVEIARANKGAAVYTDCEHVNVQGDPIALDLRSTVPYDSFALLTNFMTFHFRMIPLAAYRAVDGINENMLASEDFDLCLRLSEQIPFIRVAKVLYSYRQHRGSISATSRILQLDQAEAAIKRALKRRGIDKTYTVVRNMEGKFALRRMGV